ncbi:MAG: S41 family peptidase [Lachnospiraceae bacterium]
MDNEKKSGSGFWTGFLTACIIFLFIGCIVLSIRIFFNTTGGSGLSGKESKQVSEKADSGSVLSDPAVVNKIGELEYIIDKEYIDSVSNDQLSEGIYRGIMDSLGDPYAQYYNSEEWVKMQEETQGIYYGIGAYLLKDQDYLYPRITGVIKNTPAEEAGLKKDDIIIEVEGEDVYDQNLDDVVDRIRGEEGTSVHLTIMRGEAGNREEMEFDVARRKVETPTVSYEMKANDIGYIQIAQFDTVTVGQFSEALEAVKKEGAKGLIIDLRDNPGGSLKAVVDIAGMILPKGKVVYTEDKYGRQEVYESDGKHELDIPLAVLVNGNSASASEILSGAIKDYEKGTIIGTTTYGKGIVQQIFRLSGDEAVKLTVSHYYTPKGNDIHKVGVKPDIEVEFDRDAYLENEYDNQLEKAMEVVSDELGVEYESVSTNEAKATEDTAPTEAPTDAPTEAPEH